MRMHAANESTLAFLPLFMNAVSLWAPIRMSTGTPPVATSSLIKSALFPWSNASTDASCVQASAGMES